MVVSQSVQWDLDHPEEAFERKRRHLLSSKFGITPEQYDELLVSQGGRCAVCGKRPKAKHLDVEHDHKTGEIRGLCCGFCNKAMGNFWDDPDLMEKAVTYLRTAHTGLFVPVKPRKSRRKKTDDRSNP